MVDLNGLNFFESMTMKFNEPLKLMVKNIKKRTFFPQKVLFIFYYQRFFFYYIFIKRHF